jgi:hypothetical protein
MTMPENDTQIEEQIIVTYYRQAVTDSCNQSELHTIIVTCSIVLLIHDWFLVWKYI